MTGSPNCGRGGAGRQDPVVRALEVNGDERAAAVRRTEELLHRAATERLDYPIYPESSRMWVYHISVSTGSDLAGLSHLTTC
jgi:hypothetical protein